MPISVFDLKPGDRVLLNCPQARRDAKREAQFEGIFDSANGAVNRDGTDAFIVSKPTAEFLAGGRWARFLLQRSADPIVDVLHADGSRTSIPNLTGRLDFVGAFRVEPDGQLREDEGRRIYIERRIKMGQG